jgi:deazaflavin-dependent oxidoreductase (nitroreductase family)
MSDWNTRVIEEFRANGGKVGGAYEGTPLLLLTTTGKKSGEPRITPLVYQFDGDQIVVVASYNSAPKHPDWYLNLVAHPQVTVETEKETFAATAIVLEDAERERLLKKWPVAAEHQAKTARQIPFVVLQHM